MSPASATEVRAVERLGIGPAVALVALGLVVWLVHAGQGENARTREDFLAALQRNTAAVEKLAGTVGDLQARARFACAVAPETRAAR